MGGKDRVTLLGRERAVEVVLHAEGHEPDLGPLVLRNLPRRAHGHLARDGREPAIRLLDGLNAPAVDTAGRPVDADKQAWRRTGHLE
jgi:hypothetical protein